MSDGIERGSNIVLIGDMNGRVGSSEVAFVVRKWGLGGVNENNECLVDICAERGLFLANAFFQQNDSQVHMEERREG